MPGQRMRVEIAGRRALPSVGMKRVLLLFAIAVASTPNQLGAGEIYPYEPTPVTLTGKLYLEEQYGPPNYGESPPTDLRVTIRVLELPEPITVGTLDSLSELNAEIIDGVDRIQVVFAGASRNTEIRLGSVTLQGTLFQAHTGHQYHPVLLWVTRL